MAETARPTGQQILEMMRGYQPACVIGAAAELDLWTLLGERSLSADSIAQELCADLRATAMLLDAVAALGLLEKTGECYRTAEDLRPLLTAGTPRTVLPMVHHTMNILRSWSQLAWVVKSGIPGPRQASIRGFEADRASFIGAMHSVSALFADELVAQLGPPRFRHLLDVGGASGTWTLAFLRRARRHGDDFRLARRRETGRRANREHRIRFAPSGSCPAIFTPIRFRPAAISPG